MAMARHKFSAPPETIISIIAPGMQVFGDCETEGTLRVEGSVEGSIRAGKAVVVGEFGQINGDITTQDAVISGRVVGNLVIGSRLELQGASHVEGEVYARRIQVEEGAVLNGSVNIDKTEEGSALGDEEKSGSQEQQLPIDAGSWHRPLAGVPKR